MKKQLYPLIFSFFVALFLPVFALAQLVRNPSPIGVDGIFNAAVFAMLFIGGAIAVIMFVVAGITFLLANGAPEKTKQAKQAVLWGAIGVAVMIIGTGIVTLIKLLLTVGI